MLSNWMVMNRRKVIICLWIGLGSLSILLRASIIDIPLERDEGCFAYIAQQWRAGAVPYRDLFDHKPPGIYAAYATLQTCFGESISALRWGMFLHTLPMFVGLVLICRALTSDPYAELWACFASSVLLTCILFYGQSANCEMFAIAPGTLGFGLALVSASERQRGRFSLAFVAGICGGAALLYKHVALLYFAPSLVVAVTCGSDRFKRLCLMIVGSVCLPLLFALYFYLHGAWEEFVFCNWTYNRLYAGRNPLTLYPQLFFKKVLPMTVTFIGFAAGCCVGTIRLIGAAARGNGRFPRPAAIATLVWVFVSWLMIVPGGVFYPHYFLLTIPSVSILVAAGLVTESQMKQRLGWGLAFITCSLGPYFLVQQNVFFAPHATAIKSIYNSHNFFNDAVVWGDWLKRNTDPKDKVFIVGSEPQVLYYSRRKGVSRYPYIYPLTLPLTASTAQAEAERTLESTPPDIAIVIYSPTSLLFESATPFDFFLRLQAKLKKDYQPIAICARKNQAGLDHWSLALDPVIIEDPDLIARIRSREPGWFQNDYPGYCALVWKRTALTEKRGAASKSISHDENQE